MNEPPPVPETAPTEPGMSLGGRLFNVFATPGDVFQELKSARHNTANWLVPYAVVVLVGVIYSLVIFSQPAILQQLREQQLVALDKQVNAGKMTKAQEEQLLGTLSKPVVFEVAGAASWVFMGIAKVFWWATWLWLIAKFLLKVEVPYMKGAEIAGLGLMIVALGTIVTMLVSVMMGTLYPYVGPSLAIRSFDATNKLHLLAGAANVFNFWFVALLAVGLSRVAGTPLSKTLTAVMGYWIVQELLLIGVGLGAMAL
jgi:hypothetical protein